LAIAGGYFSNHFAPDEPRQEVQDFVKKYKTKYGYTPDALAALAYDATNVLIYAIKEAGLDDPIEVKDALANITLNGITGLITFDDQHNPVKSVIILAVKENEVKFETLINP